MEPSTFCSSLASITIPASVTTIGRSVFSNCTNLTSINIPNSITDIRRFAFRGCSSLTSITIPNSVTNLGAFAFLHCSNLARITFRGDAPTIDDYYGMLDPFGYSDETFISPDAVIIYPAGAIGYSDPFHGVEALPAASVSDLAYTTTEGNITITGCETTALGDLVIPDTIEGKPVTSIGEGAFADCTSLTSISIPNSVTSIEEGAFTGCTSLTAIEVGAGNVNYTAVDEVLFNTEMTLLHTYPLGKTGDEYTIPDGVPWERRAGEYRGD